MCDDKNTRRSSVSSFDDNKKTLRQTGIFLLARKLFPCFVSIAVLLVQKRLQDTAKRETGKHKNKNRCLYSTYIICQDEFEGVGEVGELCLCVVKVRIPYITFSNSCMEFMMFSSWKNKKKNICHDETSGVFVLLL